MIPLFLGRSVNSFPGSAGSAWERTASEPLALRAKGRLQAHGAAEPRRQCVTRQSPVTRNRTARTVPLKRRGRATNVDRQVVK